MEPIFFQIGKKAMFLQKLQHLLLGFYVTLALIFDISGDVI